MTVTVVGAAKLVDKENIDSLNKRLRSDGDALSFVVFKFVEGTKDTINVVESGEGGWEAFEKYFVADQIAWVLWRLNAGDNVSQRSKFVFLSWCGEKVKTVARVASGPQGKSLEQSLGYIHVSKYGCNADEMNPNVIREKVRQAGGVRYDHTETFDGQEKQIETDQRTK
ncbi:Cofilin/tropomyosin-type_actin-binding protein [Hexamita inflata]|uniref:Cofilin/tropomyosin-type actin-binding protein n=1 Tax=Hexamita inflata TaxID=28002 RepID=A0AA86PDW2_9EUKA|nr:Cofilin/tropomyosin-type actin-binding protein [Hexamita inflata]CAI9946374.1 Cofilin/tropomyosin-type actin-binding protein [Hexamita inflata]CAI9976891.1 Cofilin/tropomyosin-type actin-binding protein [Hexamita inflata]